MARVAEMVRRVLHRFRAAKILKMAELMASLGCSRSTVQRRLKTWGCLSSYNCNSAYYALPEVVAFDSLGVWRFGEARFSRYGNLTATVIGVIGDSEVGLSAAELGEVLGINAYSFISRFASHPGEARRSVRVLLFRGRSERAATVRKAASQIPSPNRTPLGC